MASVVGVSIRANWVEVLEAQRGLNKSIKITKFGRSPVASPDRVRIVAAIKGALEAAKIKTKDVVVGIPTQEVILRYFTLPLIPKNEWSGAVQFEARKYVPFKLDELVWDFHITERKADRRLDVIFVAARREVFAEHMALLQQAGLRASVVEAASFGLARAILHLRPALKEAAFAVVEASGEAAHVALVRDGVPQVARDVFLAGREERQSLELLMAPEQLPPAAVPDGSAAIPAPVVPSEQEQQFANLLSELKLSLDYFSREFGGQGQDVRQLILCGEQATEQWQEWLTQDLKMPVEVVQPAGIEGAKQLPAAWMLPLGLVLHVLGGPGPRVNFGRRQAAAGVPVAGMATGGAYSPRWLIAEAVLAGVALFALAVTKGQALGRVHEQIHHTQAERQATGLQVTDLAEARALRQTAQERLDLLKTVVDGTTLLTPRLAALPRALPEEVWLNGLRFRSQLGQGGFAFSGTVEGLCLMEQKQQQIPVVNELPDRLRKVAGSALARDTIRLNSIASAQLNDREPTSFELEFTQAPDAKDGSGDRQ